MRKASIAALLIVAPGAAVAAGGGGGASRIATVGAGIQTYPRFPGARAQRTAPLPLFDLSRAGQPLTFKAPDQGIGSGIVGGGSAFELGPAIQWEYSRRPGRDVPAGVPAVGFTVEAGGFVEAMLGRSLRLRAEARQGLGGHKGTILDLSADALLRDPADTTLFSIGPRLRMSDARYQRAYFGVAPAASAATGLAAFAPRAGAHAVGLWSSVKHRLGGAWGVYAYAGCDRLVGDAARSPLVRRYGRRDQVSGGIALTYSFRAPGL